MPAATFRLQNQLQLSRQDGAILTVSEPAEGCYECLHGNVDTNRERTHIHGGCRHPGVTIGLCIGAKFIHERPSHALIDFSCILS